MAIVAFLLGLGIVFRVTRFVNDDVLFEPARDAIDRRFGTDSKTAYLASCPWCASIWIAAPVAGYVAALITPCLGLPWWFTGLGVWLAYSWLYGVVSSLLGKVID
jgi:hypothetical protein